MELFRGNKDKSLSYIIETLTHKQIELEVIFGKNEYQNPVDRSTFMRVLELCKTDYSLKQEQTTLDIRQEFQKGKISNIRCSLSGIDAIKQYCKTDSLTGIEKYATFLIKRNHSKDGERFDSIVDEDYNLRMTLKDEVELSLSDSRIVEFINHHSEKKKHFRYKKRFSFQTQDKLFRIDLTVVKSTKKQKGNYQLKQRFREADILSQPEVYEIEIEYIGEKEDSRDYELNRLYQLVDEQVELLEPGKKSQGNLYNPLHLENNVFAPSEITFVPTFSPGEVQDDISYELDSPRYNPFQTDSETLVEKYSHYVGKYIRIKRDYWVDNPSVSYIRVKLDEAYEKIESMYFHRPRNDGIVTDLQETYDEEKKTYKVIAKVSLFPKIDGVDSLLIPVEQIYDYNEPIEETKLPDWAPSGIIEEDVKQTLGKKVMIILKSHIVHLSKIIYDTDTLLSQKVKTSVIRLYKQITSQSNKSYFTLKGPQPVSFDKKNLNIHHPNILVNYAVTEKADGERYQMLVTRKRGYLINAKQNVIDTGNMFPGLNGDWIFDGEYITRDKDNKPMRLFMIFDVYWNGNKTPQPIHTYPFIGGHVYGITRHLELMAFSVELYSAKQTNDAITIQVKDYEMGYINNDNLPIDKIDKEDLMEIFESSSEILTKDKEGYYPYRIDGLIYIPLKMSVGSMNEGSPVKNIGGEWKLNYKWKPPEENTIDFLVKTVKQGSKWKLTDIITSVSNVCEDGRKELREYKQLAMYIGYDKNQDTTIDYCMMMLQGNKQRLSNEKVIQFKPPETTEMVSQTNILLEDGNMLCNNIDRDIIKDGDIVEMGYKKNGKNGIIWEPLRVRKDKQKPQFFTTAYNIWKTIQEPVTSEMIQGVFKQSVMRGKLNSEQDYYVSDEKSISDSVSLRKFHNMIKKKLIVGVSSTLTKPQILDLSCGRGGDIQKYIHRDINPSFLMGIDISNNVNEACQRYYNEKTSVKGLFIRGDTSLNIKTRKCQNINDISEAEKIHTDTMLRIVYDMDTDKIPDSYRSVVSSYKKLALNGFDVISSQFSIHYYFKNQETLDGFIQNISENIKSGGYFIGTCYDGMKVFNLSDPTTEMIDEFGNLVYRIDKKYSIDDFTYNESDTSNMLGNQIDVYMDSIGQTIPEYLVNFEYFVSVMKGNGFVNMIPTGIKHPHSSLFKKSYVSDGFGDFESIVNDLESFSGDPDYTRKIDPLLYNEELKTLTSLNKYFIFQKE